jgi:hypothetical protein
VRIGSALYGPVKLVPASVIADEMLVVQMHLKLDGRLVSKLANDFTGLRVLERGAGPCFNDLAVGAANVRFEPVARAGKIEQRHLVDERRLRRLAHEFVDAPQRNVVDSTAPRFPMVRMEPGDGADLSPRRISPSITTPHPNS